MDQEILSNPSALAVDGSVPRSRVPSPVAEPATERRRAAREEVLWLVLSATGHTVSMADGFCRLASPIPRNSRLRDQDSNLEPTG